MLRPKEFEIQKKNVRTVKEQKKKKKKVP
jgi:hypothetical protein